MSDLVNNIFDFVNEYYHVFILLLLILTLFVSLFKNNGKKSGDFERVFDLVNKAEQLFPESGSGAVKLAYVIKNLPDLDPNNVIKLVDEVLSSPEKK